MRKISSSAALRARLAGLATVAFASLALLAAGPAEAGRELLSRTALVAEPVPEAPNIEAPCGLAIAANRDIYLSVYHARDVWVFDDSIRKAIGGHGVTTAPEGPCGLAFDSVGRLYVNVYHQRVDRLLPTRQTIDVGDSTGVAVDLATDRLYVNNRTAVSAYEPSGEPILDQGEPLRIGEGLLGDAYGLAVSAHPATAGRIYVADAGAATVLVFDPTGVLLGTITAPGPGFHSLTDASLAVDPTSGNLLVVDNVQPLFEHPTAIVYEFDATGAFLGILAGAPVHGEPSGIAFDPDGGLFLTDGNSELSNVFEYGPYEPAPPFAEPGLQAGSLGPAVGAALSGAPPLRASESDSRRTRPQRRRHRDRPHRTRGYRWGISGGRAR